MPFEGRASVLGALLVIASASLSLATLDAGASRFSHVGKAIAQRSSRSRARTGHSHTACTTASRRQSRASARNRRHWLVSKSCAKKRHTARGEQGVPHVGPGSIPPVVSASGSSGPGNASTGSVGSGTGSTSPSQSPGAPESPPLPTPTTPTEPTPPTAPPAPARFFSPSSFWNEPLPASAPLDPSSTALVQTFDAEIAREQKAGSGPWINTTSDGVPIYTATATQPTVAVQLTSALEPALASSWSAVPLPATAQPAAGTDGILVVWQPSSDRMWEFWQLVHKTAGWSASWGGSIQNVSMNLGVYGLEAWPGAMPWWGASASSLAIAGGLMTFQDLQQGRIEHALAMSIPNVRAKVFALPAQRTDGQSSNPQSLPEGAHLRLDPNLDLATLHLPPLTLMMAEAAQRYGILVRDRSPNVALFGQDPTPTQTNPYTGPGGYFSSLYPNQVLASFPWSHLQLLRMTLHEN
jgi:hypothetical protein